MDDDREARLDRPPRHPAAPATPHGGFLTYDPAHDNGNGRLTVAKLEVRVNELEDQRERDEKLHQRIFDGLDKLSGVPTELRALRRDVERVEKALSDRAAAEPQAEMLREVKQQTDTGKRQVDVSKEQLAVYRTIAIIGTVGSAIGALAALLNIFHL